MAESGTEDIILMAILMVTKDDVLACANELGMSKEQVTDDVIELVKEKVSQGFVTGERWLKVWLRRLLGAH